MADLGLVARIVALVLLGWVSAVWLAGIFYILVTNLEARTRLPRRPLRRQWAGVCGNSATSSGRSRCCRSSSCSASEWAAGEARFPSCSCTATFRTALTSSISLTCFAAPAAGRSTRSTSSGRSVSRHPPRSYGAFVDHVRRDTGAPAVDLLTHSTGGLFALDLIAEDPAAVRRAAVIAIPARGVPWRGPVLGGSGSQLRASSLYQANRSNRVETTPVLSAYSAHDNLVHPVTTSRLEGAAAENFEVNGPGHLSVLFDRRVAHAVVDFLTSDPAGSP